MRGFHRHRCSPQIIATCPFLAVDQASPRQWFLRQLTRAPVTLAALAGGIGHLPASLKKLIVTSYAGQSLLDAYSRTLALRYIMSLSGCGIPSRAKHVDGPLQKLTRHKLRRSMLRWRASTLSCQVTSVTPQRDGVVSEPWPVSSPARHRPIDRGLRRAGKLSADAIQTTLRLLDFQNARNAFFLGGCEFRDLWQPQPDPWQLLQRLGEGPHAVQQEPLPAA